MTGVWLCAVLCAAFPSRARTREAADIMAKLTTRLTVILRACGNSEVAGLVASTHVSTHEILRVRVATGSRRPQDYVLQDQFPHVVEGRHVQPPLVKLPSFVVEADLP